MKKVKQLFYNQWFKKYKPELNHFESLPTNDIYQFDCFNKEHLDYIDKKTNNYVWTGVSGENEENYIIPGVHFVNRECYYVTSIPWENEYIEVSDNEYITIRKAIKKAKEVYKLIGFTFDTIQIIHFFDINISPNHTKKITVGKAKYTVIEFYENKTETELSFEQQDIIHNFYSQLM